MPCTISMQTSRCFDADAPAAVFANTVLAGTIASSNGSAMVTPMPFRTARRDTCFFEMYMSSPIVRRLSSTASAVLIWKAGLLTIPRTNDEKRLPFCAAFFAIARTDGWS